MRISKELILLLCLAALPLAAQETRLAGPVSGCVFDPQARALRPIVGVPGASYLGDAIAAGLDYASVSPDGRFAVAVGQDGVTLIRGLDEGRIERAPLEGAGSAVRAAWSADSSVVALWNDAGRVEAWRDLAAIPRMTFAAELGRLAAVAVAGGERGLVVASESGAILAVAGDGAVRRILELERPAALALVGNRLFVADGARGEILTIGSYMEGGDAQLFANAARGVDDPAALAVSPDQRTLLVASRSARTLTAFDLATSEVSGAVTLDFEPTRLEKFSRSLFALTDGGDGATLQVLDSARALAVYFVPAGPALVVED